MIARSVRREGERTATSDTFRALVTHRPSTPEHWHASQAQRSGTLAAEFVVGRAGLQRASLSASEVTTVLRRTWATFRRMGATGSTVARRAAGRE